MYAVIFRARLAEPDDTYFSTAEKLRALAMEEYGCKEFVSTTEGDSEIAISYWDSEEQIRQWKSDSEHLLAQDGWLPSRFLLGRVVTVTRILIALATGQVHGQQSCHEQGDEIPVSVF